MPSEDLHPILKDIQEKIVNIREDFRETISELRKIRETIQEGVDAILEAINDNVQAQAELKIMEKVATVRSIPAQIAAEEAQIETERDELEAKLDSIAERYEKRHAELEERAEKRVRNLGEHIFEIQEEEYETNIERPFYDHVTETWREMQFATSEMGEERIDALESELAETHSSIDTLLERREQFLDDLRQARVSADTFTSPKRIQVPFWVVTVERDGTRSQEVVGPADIAEHSDEWYGLELAERSQFGPLLERVAESTSPEVTTTRELARQDIREVASEYTVDSVLGRVDFAEALGETVGDTVPVTVEGGDET